jgi:hypothetical protein
MDTSRFNEKGIDDIMSKKYDHKQYKFDNDMKKKIVDITSSNPNLMVWVFLLDGHYIY